MTWSSTPWSSPTRCSASRVPSGELLEAALSLAIDRDHSPYDTLFVALAVRRGTRLLTYDGELLRKFPEATVAVPQFLS